MEAFCALLAICEENPPVFCRFFSERASDTELFPFAVGMNRHGKYRNHSKIKDQTLMHSNASVQQRSKLVYKIFTTLLLSNALVLSQSKQYFHYSLSN